MDHVFDRYFAKHQRYPRIVVPSGVQRLTVTFHPGYVSIRSSAPFGQEVYVTRSAFIDLLRKAIPLVRKWGHHPDFDVPQAEHEAYLDELSLLREKRLLAKSFVRDPEAQSARQRKRYLAARARAQRRNQ